MGFMLRFLLGLFLLLTTFITTECASTWRHIRQVPPEEDLPKVSILDGDLITYHNESTKEEISIKNSNNKTINSSRKIEVDKENPYKKPKTENGTEKYPNDNVINVNETQLEKEVEDSLEKPTMKDSSFLKKSYTTGTFTSTTTKTKPSTDNVPEIEQTTLASRAENGRFLDININKYTSLEFHNKNNVYTFSVSPDTERYLNLHNELPKWTTSRSQKDNISENISINPLEDFHKTIHSIKDGVKQKLEYIDHEFREGENYFHKPEEDESLNVSKILEKSKDNDTAVNLNYLKFKNITNKFNKENNNIKKETELESGQNINYSASFNKSYAYEEPPKDYKNKIPIHDDNISNFKLAYKTTPTLSNSKPVEGENGQEKIKDGGASLTKPPNLNRTSNHKSLLSNKIETDITNQSENNIKLKWEFPFTSTTSPPPLSPTTPKQFATTDNNVEKEVPIYVPYSKEAINISKRGSTKYINTFKIDSTTESMTKNKTLTIPNNNFNSDTIGALNKENSTLEQTVLENQIYPVSLPLPTLTTSATFSDESVTITTITTTTETSTAHVETTTENTEDEITTVTTPFEELTTEFSPETISTTLEMDTTIPENFSSFDIEVSDGTAEPETTISLTTQPGFVTVTETFPTVYTTDIQEQTTQTSDSDQTEFTSTTDNYESDISTISTYETTSMNQFTSFDERINNGRELKNTEGLNETIFSSTVFDYQTMNSSTVVINVTTQMPLNLTTQQPTLLNNVSSTDSPRTTVDYKENTIINNQSEPIHTDEKSTETAIILTVNTSATKVVESDKSVPVEEYTTQKPFLVQTERVTTPFIIPLNISMIESDTTDLTTISNLGLEDPNDKVESSGGPIAAIVISCIGALCLIILAALLFLMRKRHKRFNYGQRCTPVSLDAYSVDNVSVYNSLRRKGAMRASKRSYGNPAFDDPSTITRPLNFPSLAKFANNTDEIATEFDEIPQVTAQTNELPEGCETKNRYANVIPLPETRVFLNKIEGCPYSDYINANYVTGAKNVKGYYIACQAPLQNTVDDFWRMVWEQQSKVILMLTHLFENGTEKCIDYLPPSEVLDCHRLFGDFQVTLKKREVKEKYVISNLQLKNMVSNSWREVTHLWYLGWPEKGVPTEANSLIAFLIEARSYIKQIPTSEINKPKDGSNGELSNGTVNVEQNPVIVHCSPGTGRTGTIIACDIAIREFELMRQVDIPKTVYRIRRDRASSVQTKEQYEFIYKVICLYATKLTGGVLDTF